MTFFLIQASDLSYILGRMLTAPFPQGRLVPVEATLDLVIRLLRKDISGLYVKISTFFLHRRLSAFYFKGW
jgi:hypothetical protein